ncbi:MAG: hypothetical protein F6K62_19830 [Sphaerospermopsis sp. SIO1G2]|nr:hypothetical protein [Sphaerospermopsis sp. SIO1G1]NET73095.1 hypothetical protein [Sphaerospermopsis sp. SIO1G2]
MLKLIYTERNFDLVYLSQSLEEWVTKRVILSLRVGKPLYLEPSTASFLIPVDLPGAQKLEMEVQKGDGEIIDLSDCDAEYMEVTLQGSWLSQGTESTEGVFVTTMSDRMEFFLHKLWQESQVCASFVHE